MKQLILSAVALSAVLLSSCGHETPKPTFNSEADSLSYILGMANSPSEAELKMYLSDPRTGSDSAFVEEFLRGLNDGMQAADNKKKAAYMAGVQSGMRMAAGLKQVEGNVFANDSTKHFSRKNFIAGFNYGVDGKHTALKVDGKPVDKMSAGELANRRIQELSKKAMAQKYQQNKENSEKFLAAKAKEEGVQQLEGGVLYKVITEGTGVKPAEGERVRITYVGSFINGQEFDASRNHSSEADKSVEMPIGRSVPGFDAALRAMAEGAEWEVYIPAEQGYGDQENGLIPPYSALVFKIKVIKVIK